MGEQPYVDRYIDLKNNTSRPERAAAYLSMNRSPISARELPRAEERISGRGQSELSVGEKSEQPHVD